MFLALEGGGFFSSSASGYSKGLTLLLLGKKNEEKPMRVSPWNQCQLVDRESNSDLQLASKSNNRVVRGCASVACFGCAAAGLESPSPLKVGPTIQTEILSEPPVSDDIQSKDDVVDNEEGPVKRLKSSLKRPAGVGTTTECEAFGEKHCNAPRHIEKRKVQWTDLSGGDLAEIREFELSDAEGSDDEYDNEKGKSCSCTIM